jgi:hypothetical protein
MYVEIGSKEQALAIRIARGMRLVPRWPSRRRPRTRRAQALM